MLLMASAVLALTGCQKEELVFDHELPQFELQADAILLEVIVPSGTAADEVIYITGEFNNGDKYQLEKAQESDKKWGIYLYESDFAEGKSLKDGFTFVSEKNGKAYTVKGEPETYTLDVAYGTRTNVWIDRWESYFKQDNPGEIVPGEYEHLYIIGNVEGTGWTPADVLEFEMVGTDIFRGEFTFSAATSYFAILTAKGESNDDWATVNAARWGASDALLTEGTVLDLKLQDGSDQCVTIAQGTYTITVNMVEKQIVIGEGEWSTGGNGGNKWPAIKHDGQDIVYVADMAGWGDMALYMWGDINKLDRDGGESADWPGLAPDGSFEFNGITWYYFLIGAANEGKNENMIFNNNGGGEQTNDANVTFGAGNEYYYLATGNKVDAEAVEDPTTVGATPEPTPDPEPGRIDTVIVTVKDTITTHLYLVDASTDRHYLYAWGTSELFGGWPGAKWNTWTSVSFLDKTFYHFEFDAVYGSEFNLIVNNKGYSELPEADQKQYDAFTLKVGVKTELFYTVKDDKMEEITPTAEEATVIRRMFRK